MIKLNRTTEYGLIALRHMSRKGAQQATEMAAATGTDGVPVISSGMTSAREVSDVYGLPFEITAKTLQRLKDTGLIQSAQGSKGGYTLQRSLDSVSLGEFLALMEGPSAVVPCNNEGVTCEYHERCEISGVMKNLNGRFQDFLAGIRLAELE